MSRLRLELEEVFGSLPKLNVTVVTSVTRYPVTGKNANGNDGNSGNGSKPSTSENKREELVTGVHPTDDGRIDEREAIAVELGGVPGGYASAFAQMQLRQPLGVSSADWTQALDDAGRFLDTWGGQAAKLGWPIADLFEWVPAGCCGLVWELRGRQVVALTECGAAIGDDGISPWCWFSKPERGE